MSYRFVIFDSDGTLADTLPWMRSVFNDLAEEFGFRRVEPREYERFESLHGAALLKELELPLWKLPRVVGGMRRRMAEHRGKLCLFNGIGEVLHRLVASGVQLGIVSSNSRANVERVLGPVHAKLIAHFACGVSMFGKASKLRQIIRASGIPREQAIYIGDEVRDAEAACQAGVAFGAVAWGHHDEQALRAQKPAEFFATVQQIWKRIVNQ